MSARELYDRIGHFFYRILPEAKLSSKLKRQSIGKHCRL